MSAKPIPNVFEVIYYTPNKTDPAATRKKFAAGIALQRQSPGFVGVPLEGTHYENGGETGVRIIEWKTYEDHMEGFRNSELFKEFAKVREGSTIGESDMKHYRFYDPLPLDPMPGFVEHLRISLKPDVDFETFQKEWMVALKRVIESPGCGGMAIGQQVEDPTKAIQIQPWMTLEDHIVTFKQGPDIKSIMAELTVVVDKYVEGGWKGMSSKPGHLQTCKPGDGA